MNIFLILFTNAIFYVILRISLVRKFRTSYSIYLKDEKGNRQTLAQTISFLIEQNGIREKQIMFLNEELTKQWLNLEQIKVVTGADKYCTEKPGSPEE